MRGHSGGGQVVRRLALAGVLALLGLLLAGGPASAHASLVGTSPAEGEVLATAPEHATLTFDETVRLPPGAVRVFDASGHGVTSAARTSDRVLTVDLPDDLDDGTYVVTWRVISSDGHPVAGALTFSVGAPSPRVEAPVGAAEGTPAEVDADLAIVQGLTYAGLFVTIGLVVFVTLLLPRERGLEQVSGRLIAVARWTAWPACLAAALLPALTAIYQAGGDVGDLLTAAPWRAAWISAETVASAILVAGTVTAVLTVRPAPSRPTVPLVAGIAALGSLALVGHTRSAQPVVLVVAADLAHVLAGAVWLGGLLGLALALPRLADRPRVAAVALSRFSTVAAALLAVVAVSGTLMAWRILGAWAPLVESSFGRTLLVKLGVVVLAVSLAVWNRLRVLPGITGELSHGERRGAALRMRRTVAVEAALLVVVLAVTGVLVDRSPSPAVAQPAAPAGAAVAVLTAQTDEVRVAMILEPQRVGSNDVLMQVQDLAGNPIEPYAVPTLSLAHDDVDLGDRPLTGIDSGTYRARAVLTSPGRWTAQISVRLSEFDNPVLSIPFEVAR